VKDMKKVFVLLLVIGFLLGAFAACEEVCEENSFQEVIFADGSSEDEPGPTPCGGGNGSGGGAPG
jgi:hypothetical protein